MTDETEDGLRSRLSRQSEDAIGKLAQDLLENPLVNGAIARAFDARDKASQAQDVAMGALNLPSAADIERLTRRLRSVSQRLEGIEDSLDRVDERLSTQPSSSIAERLDKIEEQLAGQTGELGGLRRDLAKPSGGGSKSGGRKKSRAKKSASSSSTSKASKSSSSKASKSGSSKASKSSSSKKRSSSPSAKPRKSAASGSGPTG